MTATADKAKIVTALQALDDAPANDNEANARTSTRAVSGA